MQIYKNPNQRLGGGASGVQPVYASGGPETAMLPMAPGGVSANPGGPMMYPGGTPGFYDQNPGTVTGGQNTPWESASPTTGFPNPNSGDFTYRQGQGFNPVPSVTPPTQSGMPAAPTATGSPVTGGSFTPGDGTQYGGVSTVNPQAQPFDYNQVDSFIQSSYDNAMSDLQPQIDMQNRQFEQDLINKGIDPTSQMAQDMRAMVDRGQNDMRSQVAFNAQQAGLAAQNQMFGQDATRSGLAQSGLNNFWQAALGGAQLDQGNARMINDFNLGMAGIGSQNYGNQLSFMANQNNNALQRYLGDQSYNLGLGNYGLAKEGFNWRQVMDTENLRYQDALFDEDRRRFDFGAMRSLMPNQNPVGGVINPNQVGNPFSPWADALRGFNPSTYGG